MRMAVSPVAPLCTQASLWADPILPPLAPIRLGGGGLAAVRRRPAPPRRALPHRRRESLFVDDYEGIANRYGYPRSRNMTVDCVLYLRTGRSIRRPALLLHDSLDVNWETDPGVSVSGSSCTTASAESIIPFVEFCHFHFHDRRSRSTFAASDEQPSGKAACSCENHSASPPFFCCSTNPFRGPPPSATIRTVSSLVGREWVVGARGFPATRDLSLYRVVAPCHHSPLGPPKSAISSNKFQMRIDRRLTVSSPMQCYVLCAKAPTARHDVAVWPGEEAECALHPIRCGLVLLPRAELHG